MNVINVIQKSNDWHIWRKKGISATDSVVILNSSPYKTPWRLWAEKTGLIEPDDLSKNPHVIRGNLQEDNARQAAEEKFDEILMPICCEYDKEPIFRASLDGYSSVPVELKCPADSTWEKVVNEGEESEAFKMYSVQLQHQIMVTDSAYGYLVFYKEGCELECFKVDRDDELINEIIRKGLEFWEHIKNGTEPPKDPERDSFLPKGDDALAWKQAASSFLFYEDEISILKERLKSLQLSQDESKKELTSLLVDSGFNNCEIEGVKVTSFTTKGRVSYDKLIEEIGVSDDIIEKYRGKDRSSFRVTAKKEGTKTLTVEENSTVPVKQTVIKKSKTDESLYW